MQDGPIVANRRMSHQNILEDVYTCITSQGQQYLYGQT